MTTTDAAVVGLSDYHDVMRSRARTFRWAARLLGERCRDDAALLYAFCRAADDAADESTDSRRAHSDLDALERGLSSHEAKGPAGALRALSEARGFGLTPARELLLGVRRDIGRVRVADDEELLSYAYLVAGTVGILMCGVLGARDPRAEPYAVELGIAMQLTNICRDVAEDAARGRVYLPERRLLEAGTSQAELLAGEAPEVAITRVVRELLAMADRFYESADRGMRYLPARGRLAVLIASRMYQAIGAVLRRRNCNPWRGRAVVSPLAKVWMCVVAVMAWLTLTVRSWRHPGEDRPGHSPGRPCATG